MPAQHFKQYLWYHISDNPRKKFTAGLLIIHRIQIEPRMKQQIPRIKVGKYTRWTDTLVGMEEELKHEMVSSFRLENVSNGFFKCGILTNSMISRGDRRRTDDYKKLLRRMRNARSGRKNDLN